MTDEQKTKVLKLIEEYAAKLSGKCEEVEPEEPVELWMKLGDILSDGG